MFGSDVSASEDPTILENTEINSQNIGLLQANVSSVTVIQEKKSKNSKSNKIDENKEVSILSGNALVPTTGPTGVSDGTENGDISSDQISVYVVRKDDSIAKIAEMFNISVNTILWTNDMKKGDKLEEGKILIILPINGVQHTVKKGETLKGIAKLYKVDILEIAGFNEISEDTKLAVGDELIIPDAEIAEEIVPKTTTKQTIVRTPLKILTGYFINPVPGYRRKSQGLHHGNGVDLAAPKGTPIVASASGTVIFARMGYNGGYGGLVIISHPNGTQTLYAHQSKIVTRSGAQVSQGEVIGYVGSTGRSTGPHLHFEVKGARNPAQDL